METANIKKIANEIKQRGEFVAYLPNPKSIYLSGLEYGKAEAWGFDEEKYESDTEYQDRIITNMIEHNEKAEAFNTVLESVLKFLNK